MALNTRIGPTAVAAGLGLAALANAGSAHAVTCKSIADDVLVDQPGHALHLRLGRQCDHAHAVEVAYVLSKASQPIFVFYQDASGAVPGYQSYVNSTGGTTSRPFRYWRTEADVSANDKTCTADDPGVGREVDFATTGGTLKLFDLDLVAGSGVFTGPTARDQPGRPLRVDRDRDQRGGALLRVRFGDASQFSGVAPGNQIPWTNKSYIFRRSATAFVQQFLVGAIRSLGGNASGIALISRPPRRARRTTIKARRQRDRGRGQWPRARRDRFHLGSDRGRRQKPRPGESTPWLISTPARRGLLARFVVR